MLWWLLSASGWINKIFMPSPADVVIRLELGGRATAC